MGHGFEECGSDLAAFAAELAGIRRKKAKSFNTEGTEEYRGNLNRHWNIISLSPVFLCALCVE